MNTINTFARPKKTLALSLAGAGLAIGLALGGCAQQPRSGRVDLGDSRDISADLNRAVAFVAEAQRHQRDGKPQLAIASYQKAVEAYRDFPAAWNNMGVLMLREQRYLEAAECFANAQELAPQDPRPAFNLGLTWDKAGYPADAMTHYQTALQRDGKFLPALRGAAKAAWTLRRYNESSLDIVKMALMLEREPRWRDWLELQSVRIEAELNQPTFTNRAGSFSNR
ncbi:MAG: tetratricopeptide repeat protein [Phycisphaeraceae bacterium]|nr:tetratricopeptide repeat protein [Phycisphaeraceae bacterium]